MSRSVSTPPRPIRPGDVVVSYSDALGEWAAAQVTHLDPDWSSGTAGVLDLDWSGSEPRTVEDLGDLRPLRLTHHAHTGRLSHCNYDWLLPRNCTVIGNVPVLQERASDSYSSGWDLGDQLARQRRWDRGDRASGHVGEHLLRGGEISDRFASAPELPEVWKVTVSEIDSLDCRELVAQFPNLSWLSLAGNLGELKDAYALNSLGRLRTLFITDLFGMSADDCLKVDSLGSLEMLGLHSVPAEYARAMKKTWSPEMPNGTLVEVTGARKPEWVTENRSNPLRDWDGRAHISAVRYRKSVDQLKAARREILAILSMESDSRTAGPQLLDLGRRYGEAFNQLDGTRSPFIETEEREDLLAAPRIVRRRGRSPHRNDLPRST